MAVLAGLPVEEKVLRGRRGVLTGQGAPVNVARLEHLAALLGQQTEQLSIVGQLHLVALGLVVAGQAATAEVLVGASGGSGGRPLVRVGGGRHGGARGVVGEGGGLVLAEFLVDVLLGVVVMVVMVARRRGQRPLTIHFLVRLFLLLDSVAESDETVIVDEHGRGGGRMSQSVGASPGPLHLRGALRAVNDGEGRKCPGMIQRDGDGGSFRVMVMMLPGLRIGIAIVAHVGGGVGGLVRGHGLDGRQVRQDSADHFPPGGGSTAVTAQSIGLAAERGEGLH